MAYVEELRARKIYLVLPDEMLRRSRLQGGWRESWG